jgi:hypothetical protein
MYRSDLLSSSYSSLSLLTSCDVILTPIVHQALLCSFLEVINSLLGVTSSNTVQVLLFAVVRWGVESFVASRLPCGAWQHLLTVFCWSLGEVTRFGCFLVDGILAGDNARWAKSIRYTVGPLLFPVGALGEMLMVIRVAHDGGPVVYVAAALWPLGFYPLMKQLLRQRRKFFRSLTPRGAKEIKAV